MFGFEIETRSRVENVECRCAGSGMRSAVEGAQRELGACACIAGMHGKQE